MTLAVSEIATMLGREAKTRSVVVLFLSAATFAFGQEFDLKWFTIDGGGAMFSTSGGFELSGTIGQPDAGPMSLTGGDFELTGGFWFGLAYGDCDADADVDLDNFSKFADCLSGPGGGLGPGCECFDADGNGDIDLTDVAAFQLAFTG